MSEPIFDLSPAQIAEMRGFMLSGHRSEAEVRRIEDYITTISRILGERDNYLKGLDAYRDGFENYRKAVARIMETPKREPRWPLLATKKQERWTLDEIMAREG